MRRAFLPGWILAGALLLPVAPMQAGGQADLAPLEAGGAPADAAAGQAIALWATIRNYGDASSPDFSVEFLVDGTRAGIAPVAGLAPGATSNATVAWTATLGTHALRVIADADGAVAESNESNNVLDASFAVLPPALPDLAIASLTLLPDAPQEGDLVNVSVLVQNRGTGSAGAFHVSLAVDGQTQDTRTVPALSPGDSATVPFTWAAVRGNHQLRAEADSQQAVQESNETNNGFDRALAVSAQSTPLFPNLALASFSVNPRAPRAGDSVLASVVVANQGSVPAEAFRVGFAADGVPAGAQDVPGLAAGASIEVRFPWTAAREGSHVLRAEADVDRAVQETREDDNVQILAVDVAPPPAPSRGAPDLALTDLSVEPASPRAGSGASIAVVVRNVGSADAPPFDVDVQVDGVSLGRRPLGGLAAGQEFLLRFPWNPTAGTHLVQAVADAAQAVSEPNEANNAAARTIQVAPATAATGPLPNWIVDELGVSVPTPSPGEMVTFTAALRNGGNAVAASAEIRFSVDGKVVLAVRRGPLVPGATENVSAPWQATTGRHLAAVQVDVLDEVVESSEADNERNLGFDVPTAVPAGMDAGPGAGSGPSHGASGAGPGVGSADNPSDALNIVSIHLRGETVTGGDLTRFVADVHNRGSEGVPRVVVNFLVDGRSIGRGTDSVAGNATVAIASPPWTAAVGTHRLEATIDAPAQASARVVDPFTFTVENSVAAGFPPTAPLLVLLSLVAGAAVLVAKNRHPPEPPLRPLGPQRGNSSQDPPKEGPPGMPKPPVP